MIPLIGTWTLPALSAIVGLLVIFCLITIPDWYKRHRKSTRNENIKSSGSLKKDGKILDTNDQQPRSKPCIELKKNTSKKG